MSSTKEAFIQLQESEYISSEAFQIKKHLTMPAATKQQAPKPNNTKTNGKS
jgi:hypothetical protein